MIREYWQKSLASLGLLLMVVSAVPAAKTQKVQKNPNQAAKQQAQAAKQQAEAAKQQAKVAEQQLKAAEQQLTGVLIKVDNLLAQAKHDYDGHRAHAMGHVHKAIHTMQPKQKVNTPSPNQGNTKGESQQTSDNLLKTAAGELNAVLGVLKQFPQGHHVYKSEQHIHDAIKELGVALQIK